MCLDGFAYSRTALPYGAVRCGVCLVWLALFCAVQPQVHLSSHPELASKNTSWEEGRLRPPLSLSRCPAPPAPPRPPQRFAVHQPLSRTWGRFFPVAYVSQSQFLLLAARELQLFRTCGPQRGLRRSGENTVLIERTRRSKRQPHFTSGMGRWTLMEHEAKRVLPAASGATCL